MGRWATEAYEGVRDKNWWVVCLIGQLARVPVDHMRHWLQKRAGESLTTITELVWDQASKVLLEFSDLLKDDSFEIRFRPVSDLADSVEWGSFATLVTVEQAIDF